jgi:hypothetical protein
LRESATTVLAWLDTSCVTDLVGGLVDLVRRLICCVVDLVVDSVCCVVNLVAGVLDSVVDLPDVHRGA